MATLSRGGTRKDVGGLVCEKVVDKVVDVYYVGTRVGRVVMYTWASCQGVRREKLCGGEVG